MKNTENLPKFKYHPNLYQSGYVIFGHSVCQCCDQEVDAYIETMYSKEDVDCICLECVASGKAAEKFGGCFVQAAEDGVSDNEKTEELFRRTPGYECWQGEYWLTCCGDYCAYIGSVGIKELEKMGIADAVLTEYEQKAGYSLEREYLTKDGSLCGYLFRCLHCGRYHLGVDAD